MTKWTDKSIAEIRALANEGMSASEIAAEMSRRSGVAITRNSITGMVNRFGITLQTRYKGNSKPWPQAAIDILITMASAGASSPAVRDAIHTATGILYAKDTVCRHAEMHGVKFKRPVAAPAQPKLPRARKAPQARAPRQPRARSTRATSPALSPIDPPFLPPVPLVREYVPTGKNAVSFLDSREFACKAFLPGEPVTAAGLVCGNPVVIGAAYRFCPACSESLTVRAKAPTPSTFVTLGKRRAAA